MLLPSIIRSSLYISTPLYRSHFQRTMASSATLVPAADLESFSAHLKSSDRILALLGAGLSASSGLPTFRGAGGLWRNHEAMMLATPEAFAENPGLVWQFYSYRRHMALRAQPNKAHHALAELAKKKKNFVTLSQNVDGTLRSQAQYIIVYIFAKPWVRAKSTSGSSRSATTSTAWLTLRYQMHRLLL